MCLSESLSAGRKNVMIVTALTLLIPAAAPGDLTPVTGAVPGNAQAVHSWLAVTRTLENQRSVREGCLTMPLVEALARKETSKLYDVIRKELGKRSADRLFATVAGNLTGVDPFVPDLKSIWQGSGLVATRLHRLHRLLEVMTAARSRGADRAWLEWALIRKPQQLVSGPEMIVCPAGTPLLPAPSTNADPVSQLSSYTMLYIYSRNEDFLHVGPGGSLSTTQWAHWVAWPQVLLVPVTTMRLRVMYEPTIASLRTEHVPGYVLKQAPAGLSSQGSSYRLVPGGVYPITWSQSSWAGHEVDQDTAWLQLWGFVIGEETGAEVGRGLPLLLQLTGENEGTGP